LLELRIDHAVTCIRFVPRREVVLARQRVLGRAFDRQSGNDLGLRAGKFGELKSEHLTHRYRRVRARQRGQEGARLPPALLTHDPPSHASGGPATLPRVRSVLDRLFRLRGPPYRLGAHANQRG
jgi:hypothetical protein